MPLTKKLEEMSPELQSLIEEEHTNGDISEELYQKMKSEGVTAEDWHTNEELNIYFGGNAPKEFVSAEELEPEEPVTPEEAEESKWFSKLRKALNKFDEKVLRIEVRRKDPLTGVLQYIKGGTIRWNVDSCPYTEILDNIGGRFKGGTYHLTFKPDKKNSKIQPFTRQETIITEDDSKESSPPFYQPPAEDNVTKEVIEKTLGSVNALVSQFQGQVDRQSQEFKTLLTAIMERNSGQIKEMMETMRIMFKNQPVTSTENPQGNVNPQQLFNDTLQTVAALMEKMTPQQPNVEEILDKRLKAHDDALQLGIDIGKESGGELEEDEGEGESEEESREEKKPDDRSIVEVVEDGVKEIGTSGVKELVKSLIEGVKPKKQPETAKPSTATAPTASTTPTQKTEQTAEATPDTSYIETALGQLEALFKGEYADEAIVQYLKDSVSPKVLGQLKKLPKEQVKAVLKQYKPSLLENFDRLSTILSMS